MNDIISIDEAMARIGKRLAALRIVRGLTQNDLSAKTGISVGTIQRIESGIDSRLSTIILILNAFGLSDRLENIIPDQTNSPVQMFLNQKKIPKRCSAARKKKKQNAKNNNWVWGEDQ